jgi:ribosomal protein S27E
MQYEFEPAQTVAICRECGEDIWPGDIVLTTIECRLRLIFCEECGKLYVESQELGQDQADGI